MTGCSAFDPVHVRQGKYAGNLFVVLSTEGGSRVFIADGRLYMCDKPKKKNIRHLQKTQINLKDVAGRLAGTIPIDGWLGQKISSVSDNGSISCRQGG